MYTFFCWIVHALTYRIMQCYARTNSIFLQPQKYLALCTQKKKACFFNAKLHCIVLTRAIAFNTTALCTHIQLQNSIALCTRIQSQNSVAKKPFTTGADNILKLFYLFCKENKSRHFMWIVYQILLAALRVKINWNVLSDFTKVFFFFFFFFFIFSKGEFSSQNSKWNQW